MSKKQDEPNIPFNPKTGKCICFRCGFGWQASKDADGNYIEIQLCRNKKCKSRGWNQPRVYGGKYLGGSKAMAVRFKPTGRAAAKLKKSKLPDR